MELKELITEFATAARIANPTAVEGVWHFSADGHVFGVAEDDTGSVVWIYGEIPAPSPEREDAFRKVALEANFFMRGTCGALLSINPTNGAYTLMQSMPLRTATRDEFFAFVEKFVNTLATWKGISNETQQATATDARQEASEAPAKLMPEKPEDADGEATASFHGMLRV